jgi:hypothetical protein
MIKTIVEDTMDAMEEKLISYGLLKTHLKDTEALAETTLLLFFRDKIINGETQELLNILNGSQALGGMAFVHNFLLDRSKKSMEKKLKNNYKEELSEKLQMNSTSAALVSHAVMPEIVKACIQVFSTANINARRLAKMVDDGLPFHPPISSSL